MERRIELRTSASLPSDTLRIMPCHIDFDGPAAAADLQERRTDDSAQPPHGASAAGQYEAYLRGRRLQGEEILPGYTAQVFDASDRGTTRPVGGVAREDADDMDEPEAEDELEEVKVWRETARCGKIIAYGNSGAPSVQALKDWIAMAECIHST